MDWIVRLATNLGAVEIPTAAIVTRYAEEPSRFVEVGGVRVHCRDEGSGPVLLLLHGVCASLHTWDGWVGELQDQFRLIRIDLPGFGLSDPLPREQYCREGFLEFFERFRAKLGLRRFSLAGNSLGGYVAWNVALRHAEQVDKLILIDPVGYPQKLPWMLRLGSIPLLRPLVRRMMPRFMFSRAVWEVFGDSRKITPEIRDRYFTLAMREGNKSAYVDVFAAMRELARDPTISAGIGALRTPTLLMWGQKDRWIPFEKHRLWLRDLPQAKFIAYPGAGHTPMEELPERTAGDARAFLQSTPAPERIEKPQSDR